MKIYNLTEKIMKLDRFNRPNLVPRWIVQVKYKGRFKNYSFDQKCLVKSYKLATSFLEQPSIAMIKEKLNQCAITDPNANGEFKIVSLPIFLYKKLTGKTNAN